MLSRIAEALFWVGRYVERAEDTARILDVHYQILLEDPWVDEAATCTALLDVMGVGRDVVAPTPRGVSEVLAYDGANPTAITGALWAARENARGVRDTISAEMWECLNATWHAIREGRARPSTNPLPFFGFVKERAAHFAGLAESTMSRDEAWRFMCLGTALERVDMTCRLLTARWTDAGGSAGWVTTLRCCAAHEAYLRTYRRAVDTSIAASFMLLDRLFPRSVYYSLAVVERRLAELSPGAGRHGTEDAARRAVGQARTALEFRRIDELLVDLPATLAEVQAAGAEASAAVTARYFHHTQPMQWIA